MNDMLRAQGAHLHLHARKHMCAREGKRCRRCEIRPPVLIIRRFFTLVVLGCSSSRQHDVRQRVFCETTLLQNTCCRDGEQLEATIPKELRCLTKRRITRTRGTHASARALARAHVELLKLSNARKPVAGLSTVDVDILVVATY